MKFFGSMLRFVVIIVAICLGALVAFFNMDPVVISMPFGNAFRLPLAVVMLMAFLFGVLTMFFQFSFDLVRRTFVHRKIHRELKSLRTTSTGISNENLPGAPSSGPSVHA